MLARLQKGVKKDVKIVAGCCVETGVKTCDVPQFISRIVSETICPSIIAMEDQYELVCIVSNVVISDDLG